MIVHNPTDTPVRDYPIQDPKTGDVLIWSINPGETLDFPDYAGKYLLDIYKFLQRIVTKEQLAEEKKADEQLNKGQHFSQVKIVGEPEPGFTNENMGEPPLQPEQLQPKNPVLTPPVQQPDMAGQIEGDEADKVEATPPPAPVQPAQPTSVPSNTPAPSQPKSGGLICPECKSSFQNKAALKTHYAHAHLTIPGIG